jgi:hypothetical protein
VIGDSPAWRGVPAAAAQATKLGIAESMKANFVATGGGADIQMCFVPSPMPPRGAGVVLDGSKTVVINNLPACREGDTVTEALGGPNKIVMGCKTVMIGG